MSKFLHQVFLYVLVDGKEVCKLHTDGEHEREKGKEFC